MPSMVDTAGLCQDEGHLALWLVGRSVFNGTFKTNRRGRVKYIVLSRENTQ